MRVNSSVVAGFMLILVLSLMFSFYASLFMNACAQRSPPVYAVLDHSIGFRLDAYNTTISFDHDLYFTNPDVYWIWTYDGYPTNTTALTLVGVWMKDLPNTEPLNITITVINANITIHSLYQSKQIRLTAYPPSGEYFELYISTPFGMPRYTLLKYSNGEQVVLHAYLNSIQDFRKLKKKLCQYYDPSTKTYMLRSPSHSPVEITISWTREPMQAVSISGVSTTTQTPTAHPTPYKPSTEETRLIYTATLVILVIAIILVLNYYICFLGVMCRRR